MPSREQKVRRTRKKLQDSFQRLINGKPINICGDYKISPSKVEDEAGVARSTLYGEKYKDILKEIQSYKAKKTASESGLSDEIDLWKSKLKSTKEELAKEKVARKEVTAKAKDQEQMFIQQLGEQMDRLSFIVNKLPTDMKKQVDQLLQGDNKRDSENSNVISLVPCKR